MKTNRAVNLEAILEKSFGKSYLEGVLTYLHYLFRLFFFLFFSANKCLFLEILNIALMFKLPTVSTLKKNKFNIKIEGGYNIS